MAFLSSLNVKAFKLGDNNISPSDLGVGKPELLLSLEDGMGRLDGGYERLDLLETLDAATFPEQNSQISFIVSSQPTQNWQASTINLKF